MNLISAKTSLSEIMEQGNPDAFPESGILHKSLLSLKRNKLPFGETINTGSIRLYKHYLLIFKPQQQQEEEDCLVFDTKNGITSNVKTGLDLYQRSSFSFCYWKENIYVLFGGLHHSGQSSFGGNQGSDPDVHFLYVIEKDGQISFEVESCNLKDKEWGLQDHSAQIYQDNMYIIGKKLLNIQEHIVVNKFDLNERKWSSCQVTGDVPKFANFPATVLFGKKIFIFGSYTESTGSGGGGGGLFGGGGRGGLFGRGGGGGPKYSNDLIALDLENMKMDKLYDQSFFQERDVGMGIRAELVGDKIYISAHRLNEFMIYDPIKNEFLKSDGFPAAEHWRITSSKNHSILFKISPERADDSDRIYLHIQYQIFVTSTQSVENNDPLGVNKQQIPYMESLWKEKPFTDVTFVVQNEEVLAHRVILLKSRYFQNMFNSGMLEAKSDRINVPDISPENFKAILEYIYCDKINLTESLAMELIILADKYFLPNLKADCENYLSAKLTVANFLQVVKVAEIADSEKLEKKVVSFLTSNIEKVKQEADINLIPAELFVKAIIDLKSNKK